MLTWFTESYLCTAADAAASWVMRLYTRDGLIHNPHLTGKVPTREDWIIHRVQIYVWNAGGATGMKAGLVGHLMGGLDSPGVWTPIGGNPATFHPNAGIAYSGEPFVVTHGIGWGFYKPALIADDTVFLRVLYEPVSEVISGSLTRRAQATRIHHG